MIEIIYLSRRVNIRIADIRRQKNIGRAESRTPPAAGLTAPVITGAQPFVIFREVPLYADKKSSYKGTPVLNTVASRHLAEHRRRQTRY